MFTPREILAMPTRIATIEATPDVPLHDLLAGVANIAFALEPAPQSPQGYQWHEVFIAGDRGAEHTIADGTSFARTLHELSTTAGLPALRIMCAPIFAPA